MDPSVVELSVLGFAIRNEESLFKLREKGISQSAFVHHQQVYDFIQDYRRDYKKLPTADTIATVCNVTISTNGHSDEDFYTDQLLDLELKRKVEVELLNAAKNLATGEPQASIEKLMLGLGRLRRPSKLSFGYTDGDANNRLDMIRQRRELAKLYDGYFSLPVLKNVQTGVLIGIIGRTNVGKSFLLQRLCIDAYLKGKRILFLSPEMPKDEVDLRWDSLISKVFNADSLIDKPELESSYKEWLEKASTRSDWITFDSNYGRPFTPEVIDSQIVEFQPDVVAVDGLSLLSSSSDDPSGGWEGVKETSNALQAMAVARKVYIISTQQANRGAADKPTPDLYNVAFGDGFAQSSGVILSMGYHPDDIRKRVLTVPKNRYGSIIHKPFEIDFDPSNGIVID